MRIIFLNCWHGELLENLLGFMAKHSSDTDIFGLLELSPAIFSQAANSLKNFWCEYAENSPRSGQAIFVSERISHSKIEKIDLYEQLPGDTGCLQRADLNIDGKKLAVGCVHGKAFPGDKLDSDIRLSQSNNILESFEGRGSAIIGGDFNLLPETKSIKMFEKAGYRNLIKEFGIKSTRNRHAWEQAKKQYEREGRKFFGKQYFADYCFVSPEIKVKSFEVPNIVISDHLPLILDFEL